MPKKLPPKNSTWVQLTKDFVSEWPEVLEGIHFTNMPVKYLLFINLKLKNNITIHYNIGKELKRKSQVKIAKFLRTTLEKNYRNIKGVQLKFNIPALRKDIENKTSNVLSKSFH
jgi:homoserine trans-succinylase